MMRQLLPLGAMIVMLFMFAPPTWAYVYCTTKVTEIYPNRTTGFVYFHFADGTEVRATTSSEGLERNFAVALAALMADRQVKIVLTDGYSCGVDNTGNWSYLVAV